MKNPARNADYLSSNLGTALVDRTLLRALSTLWDGPLLPHDLPRIELAVRAFLTSPVLVVSRTLEPWTDELHPHLPPVDYEQPFADHLLDYEFVDPSKAHPWADLGGPESTALQSLVSAELAKAALAALPKSVDTGVKVSAFWDAWYKGFSEQQCIYLAETAAELDEDYVALKTVTTCHWILHNEPADHAKYLVGTHRAGLVVYADSPLSRICQRHIFSEWPDRLYAQLDDDFRAVSRELRGPSVGIELPPLTALLLSRARNRAGIPYELRDMREEYELARNELWGLMTEMWFAPTVREQIKILSTLKKAASSLFVATFPERFDTLGFALSAVAGVVTGSPSAVSSVGSRLLDHDKPNARVSAISFTNKLSTDLRKNLRSTVGILRKHLTHAELREFGADAR
jgi:hypothetical protein